MFEPEHPKRADRPRFLISEFKPNRSPLLQSELWKIIAKYSELSWMF